MDAARRGSDHHITHIPLPTQPASEPDATSATLEHDWLTPAFITPLHP